MATARDFSQVSPTAPRTGTATPTTSSGGVFSASNAIVRQAIASHVTRDINQPSTAMNTVLPPVGAAGSAGNAGNIAGASSAASYSVGGLSIPFGLTPVQALLIVAGVGAAIYFATK